ncbi:FMR1 neighbor protein [Mesoplodon densirostris]|uniref:FMR1 neighbor protein n=1 Tax=Mesoplodon densirostris TaxID=48708 RepID=UPI0028DC1883|nr:FMR1 neighbor protein [Mesoplodon densirostris]
MATKAKPGPQASRRGIQAKMFYSVVKAWACKHPRLLLFGVWVLLLLLFYYYLSTRFLNSTSPGEYILWSNEDINGQPLGGTAAWETLLSFFFPITCIPQENQVVEPCSYLRDLSKSECLRYKCCYSSSKINNSNCFIPLKDKPTQMFRMFGLGAISMFILGYLPIYYYLLCQRRKVNRILKALKNRRSKLKRDGEMLGKATDEEGLGDEKEQETKGWWGGDGAGGNLSDEERWAVADEALLARPPRRSPPAGGPSYQQAVDQYQSEARGFGTPALKDISLEIFFKNM